MNLRQLGALFGTVLVLATGVSAHAATEAEARSAKVTRTAVVHYDSEALARDGGAQALRERLQSAARRVCGPVDRDLRAQKSWTRCYEAALAAALESVGEPRVAAVNE